MKEFKVNTFAQHINEAKNVASYFNSGYHVIVLAEYYKELPKVQKKFNTVLIAVLFGVNYLVSVKKTKSLKQVEKACQALRGIENMIPVVIYNADTKEFFQYMNPGEDIKLLDKNSGRGISASNWRVTSNGFALTDIEKEITIAKTGHINDYEAIGAKIKK